MTNVNSIENHIRRLVEEFPANKVHIKNPRLAFELKMPVAIYSPYAAVVGGERFPTVLTFDGVIKQTTHADAFGGGAS